MKTPLHGPHGIPSNRETALRKQPRRGWLPSMCPVDEFIKGSADLFWRHHAMAFAMDVLLHIVLAVSSPIDGLMVSGKLAYRHIGVVTGMQGNDRLGYFS